MTGLTHLSLFTGIGGIDLGLDRAGIATVGMVERDAYCRRILAQHWRGVPIHDDVTTITPSWIETLGRIDVVSAGFPCQPFSRAGKQLGADDERWLWPATARAVRMARPRYVLLENVSALTTDGAAFGTILADLHTLGFDAEWATLRASDFGAPHNRERVYVLAYPQGVYGLTWDRVGPGGKRQSQIATGGLPRPSVHQRRESASGWLAREPRVDRLVDGVPSQVDRLRVAGNAVVPQVAEWFGRIIADHAREAAA